MTQKRIAALQQLINTQTLLITDQNDIYYYTGYPLSDDDQAYLLVSKTKATLLVSPLNNDALGINHITVKFITQKSFSSLKHKEVGYDEYDLRAYRLSRFKKQGLTLRPAAALIKHPRMIKEKGEIELMKKGIRIDHMILKELEPVGRTEQQIAQELEIAFLRHNARKSFEPIVTSGKNAAFIHSKPQARRIRPTDLVVIDFGARVQRYCTDMTRMFCEKPRKKEREMVENIAAIQHTVIDAIEPGMAFGGLQDIYEKEMRKRRYKIMHGIGHGVGLNVHERPHRDDILEKGMVITVEPGVYIKGFGGCRIEDMVLVKNKPVVLSQNE